MLRLLYKTYYSDLSNTDLTGVQAVTPLGLKARWGAWPPPIRTGSWAKSPNKT